MTLSTIMVYIEKAVRMSEKIMIRLKIAWLEESLSFAVKNGTKNDRRELQRQIDQLRGLQC